MIMGLKIPANFGQVLPTRALKDEGITLAVAGACKLPRQNSVLQMPFQISI